VVSAAKKASIDAVMAMAGKVRSHAGRCLRVCLAIDGLVAVSWPIASSTLSKWSPPAAPCTPAVHLSVSSCGWWCLCVCVCVFQKEPPCVQGWGRQSSPSLISAIRCTVCDVVAERSHRERGRSGARLQRVRNKLRVVVSGHHS